jgi:hypothetical protein
MRLFPTSKITVAKSKHCLATAKRQPTARLLCLQARSFLVRQYFAIARVAVDNHSTSWARAKTSATPKYFGALAAGLPNGLSNLAAVSGPISCS